MARSGSRWRRNVTIVRANASTCWRCGRDLNPEAIEGDPDFPTVGHLVAVEDGGTDDLDNLAAECAKCNYGDGARRTNAKRSGEHTNVWHNNRW